MIRSRYFNMCCLVIVMEWCNIFSNVECIMDLGNSQFFSARPFILSSYVKNGNLVFVKFLEKSVTTRDFRPLIFCDMKNTLLSNVSNAKRFFRLMTPPRGVHFSTLNSLQNSAAHKSTCDFHVLYCISYVACIIVLQFILLLLSRPLVSKVKVNLVVQTKEINPPAQYTIAISLH